MKFTEWHEIFFPKATLIMQIRKYKDEKQEYYEASSSAEKFKELIDCLIVAKSIRRFDNDVSDALVWWVKRELDRRGISEKQIKRQLNIKMGEIENRKQIYKNKQYQHEPTKRINYKTGEITYD